MSSSHTLKIFYGSETGTAQDVAESLWYDARYRNIPSEVHNFGNYTIQNLSDEHCVVFVIATSGQGEMPVSIRHNWRILCCKSLPNNLLQSVGLTYFAVLGLGDSSYQKYNFAGKKLYRRLNQLGSIFLTELGLADDQHELGVEGTYENFRDELFQQIWKRNLYPGMILNPDDSGSLPARYKIIYDANFPSMFDEIEDDAFVETSMLNSERLTAETHFQDAEELRYSPGDVLMVHPNNLPEALNIVYEILGFSDDLLDRPFTLIPRETCIPLPSPHLFKEGLTLRRCFERYFDLQMVPRRSFFRTLGKLSLIKEEKERLLELAKNIDDYMEYCWRPRRTVAETLRDFHITIRSVCTEMLFDIFSPIRARAFSIASCPLTHSTIQILVAQVKYKSKRMASPRLGLCSTYLIRRRSGDTLLVKIRKGTFRWPKQSDAMILVGPGTGVSSFRSILAYRKKQLCDEKDASILFFGCRGAQKDYYFASEWQKLTAARIIVAFSRDQENKIYVQNKIKEYADEVWNLLKNSNGHLFIAGRAGDMPREVTTSVEEIANNKGEDGKDFIHMLESNGRLQYDTWN
ncbi:unnamed protein product [Thelazia callipaeda]|uniref:NADPH-dependent diflavin oxidoreductase 1 n=1 Tax=Thelazia callipaeda TaxID=103827 RepID=A0A0N5D562_THECL|nr:unnamed protein product [Thelazia callipaeda]